MLIAVTALVICTTLIVAGNMVSDLHQVINRLDHPTP